jgi:hypothetical protein
MFIWAVCLSLARSAYVTLPPGKQICFNHPSSPADNFLINFFMPSSLDPR